MKKLTLVVAASFTLLSFSAFAGDCLYGHDAKIAQSTVEKEPTDPKLLALLKKQEEQLEKSTPIATFN